MATWTGAKRRRRGRRGALLASVLLAHCAAVGRAGTPNAWSTVAQLPRHIPRERDRGPGVGRAGVADGRAVRKEREYKERGTQTPLPPPRARWCEGPGLQSHSRFAIPEMIIPGPKGRDTRYSDTLRGQGGC